MRGRRHVQPRRASPPAIYVRLAPQRSLRAAQRAPNIRHHWLRAFEFARARSYL